MSTTSNDLSIDGPGSPISFKKFIDLRKQSKPFSVLLDQTGDGIAMDDPEANYITADACKIQALWFLETYPGKIPLYAARHIHFMFEDALYKYKTSKEFAEKAGVDEDHPDLKMIQNKFKYGAQNPEFLQILGLIQLFSGTLTASKKENKSVRIFLEHPETHMHPQRASRLMSMIYAMDEEFGDGLMNKSDD